jgi:hypothetical protein
VCVRHVRCTGDLRGAGVGRHVERGRHLAGAPHREHVLADGRPKWSFHFR